MKTTFTYGFKRYFANTSWLMAEKVLRMTVALFVVIYVARYLGPERFGLLSYAISFVGLFSAFSTLGLDGIVVRELVKTLEKQHDLIGTVFVLKILGSVLTLGLLAIAVRFTQNDRFTNFLIFIIATGLVFQSFSVIDFYFQSRVQSKYVVFVHFTQMIISLILNVIFVAIKAPLLWFAVVSLINSSVLGLGLVVIYTYKRQQIWRWRTRLRVGKNLLKDSWPLILSGITIAVYTKIDQVMIKEMLDAEAVGNYAAAVRLSEAWYFVPMVICNSLFPAIINAKKRSEELYYRRLQRLYDLTVWMAVVVALPTTFLSNWIIHILYGEQFSLASGVLAIHIWAGVFVFLGVASGKWFLAQNLQIYSFYRTFCGCIVNILLNLLLIQKYGIKGAAISTLISYSFATYFSLFTAPKTYMNLKLMTNSLTFQHVFKNRYTK